MEKVKVDNKHLNKVADSMEYLIEHMQTDISNIRNEEADQFVRFMAYNRIKTYITTAQIVLKTTHALIMSGHTIHSESLQTNKAKENEWDIVKAEQHPFFIQTSEGDDDNDMESTLKKIFAKHVVETLFKQSRD